jgi:signal transduction histidine kinase
VARIDAVPRILEVICRTTGLGFSAVARVTEESWIACAVRDEIAFGLQPGGELQIATTLCNEVRAHGEAIVIDHVSEDRRFCHHPTPKTYGFQSYISMPIFRKSGEFFGTLCAIDPKPARINTPETVETFRLFAELIAFHLDAHDRVSLSERALLDERKVSELREQFIAVLGHDLRTPLGAISAAARVIEKSTAEKQAGDMATLIKRSVARMGELIENVLDLTRSRLGSGLALSPKVDPTLAGMLEQVVSELRAASPERSVESDVRLTRPVVCDSARIAQLLANLVSNALTHGDPTNPVRVVARTDDDTFTLSVTNRGASIPPEVQARLFEPFYRGARAHGDGGLGLGLYISSEIARAHDGTLEVTSAGGETCFTFRMPTAPGMRRNEADSRPR